MISADKKALFRQVINCFENDSNSPKTDYATIYIYKDGPNERRQITIGFGITEYGNLKKLIEYYIEAKGRHAEAFDEYVDFIGYKPLVDNKDFIRLMVKSAKEDQVFRDCEDRVFEDKYFAPALKFFNDGGFSENLSLMVILDSYIHSGSIPSFLRSRFPAKTPKSGGSDYEWIAQYVGVRRAWLANHSRPALRNTVYRMDCFKKQIGNRNWAFNPPIIANGVTLTS